MEDLLKQGLTSFSGYVTRFLVGLGMFLDTPIVDSLVIVER